MSGQCENCKANPVDIAQNTKGTPTAKLIAILIAHGITDNKQLAEATGLSLRAIQHARATHCAQPIASDSATHCAEAQPIAQETQPIAPSRADSINNITNTTPGDSRASANSADELARQAYLDGLAIKHGKVAKSARAETRTKGELDGSKGITFANGELTVDTETAVKILAKFPGIDVQAACDKAAPEVSRLNYPTRDDAAAVIGKWARIEMQNASKSQAKTGDVVPFKVTTAMWVKPREETAYAG